MKLLHISEDLSLPIDAITHKFAILGTSGSGKSYTAMKLAELMLDAGAQTIAVDPVGIWWSLRLSADGKTDGFKQVVVFGGENGDLPLTPESGGLVARMLAERAIPAVLDVSQFISSEQVRFLAAFGEQFFESKKTHKSPVHLFLEECQTVVPEEPQRDENLMLNRWRRLIKFGRNYGVGVSLVSQQPQAVDKKVLNECPTLFAMRTVGGHQRKAILSWVKDVIESESDLVSTLPRLSTGTAHVWSPEWLKISRDVKIAKKITFDAGKTPEIGTHAVEPRPLTKIDVDQFKGAMAEMIEKAKADDPKELKKEIQRLKSELVAKPTVAAPTPVILQKAINDAIAARDAEWMAMLTDYSRAVKLHSEHVDHEIGALMLTLARFTQTKPERKINVNVPAYTPPVRAHVPMRSMPVQVSDSNGKLRAGAERMLSTLVQWYPQPIAEGRLRAHAGMKKSGTYSTYKSDMIVGGYAELKGDGLAATQKGIDYFGGSVPDAPSTTEDVLATWRPKLRDGARRMLDVLVSYRGQEITRERLFQESGLTASGTASTYLSDLRTAQLVVSTRDSVAANKETLFL